jgi:hypothetical protein
LQWGKPDTLSPLTSVLDDWVPAAIENGERELYPTPEYFKADIPFNSKLICIRQNDWPYSGTADTVIYESPELTPDGAPLQFLLKSSIP